MCVYVLMCYVSINALYSMDSLLALGAKVGKWYYIKSSLYFAFLQFLYKV